MKRRNEFAGKTDVELLAAVKENRRGALETLMQKYNPVLKVIIHGILRTRLLEEDVLQDTRLRFVLWLKKDHSYEGMHFPRFIKRVAYNRAVSVFRKEHSDLYSRVDEEKLEKT